MKITANKTYFERLRDAFIYRMTHDSDTQDRRRKDFHQAIFAIKSNEEIDCWNEKCVNFGLRKKEYGSTYPIWDTVDMDMVLNCFDMAVKDILNKQLEEIDDTDSKTSV